MARPRRQALAAVADCMRIQSLHGRSRSALYPTVFRKVALAVECFHKASLIHDDIEDDDAERYGQQTIHAEHGIPVALNVGDLLVGEGYRLLAESAAPPHVIAQMIRIASAGHRSLCLGQGAELCWSRNQRPMGTAGGPGHFPAKDGAGVRSCAAARRGLRGRRRRCA